MELTDLEITRLGEGWPVIRDGLLTPEQVDAARAALLTLPLRPATVGAARHLRPDVRGDHIVWLEPADAPAALRPALDVFDALLTAGNRDLWLGLRDYEVQAARYPPGARYDWHVDAFRGDPRRRLTALLWLNPGWVPAHGGELLIDGGDPVAPLAGRGAVFLADRVRHAVAPTTVERLSLTAWYRGG
jgi:SM-20-related protein